MTADMIRTRKAVWELMADLEFQVRYHSAKADRLKRLAFAVRFVLLAGVIAEGLLFYQLSSYSWSLAVIVPIGVAIGALAIWDALANYHSDAAILKIVSQDCVILQREAERLWRNLESEALSRDEAEETYLSIHIRWERATERAIVPDDVKLAAQCAKDSNTVMVNRYAVAS